MRDLKIYVCLITEDRENIWHQHLTRTLHKMGHKIFTPENVGLLDTWKILAQGFSDRCHMERTTENILKDVKEIHGKSGIDLFFCYLYPFQFTPRLFKELTRSGIPSIYYFCDNFVHNEVAKEYAPFATLNWVPEKGALRQFESSGSRFIYLPMAANPDIFYPTDAKERVDISFVGSKNPYRRDLLGQALSAGLDLKVYGGNWHTVKDGQDSNIAHESKPLERISTYLKFKKNALSRLMRYGLTPSRHRRWYSKLGEEYEDILRAVAVKGTVATSELNEAYSFSAVSIGINDSFNPLFKDGLFFYTKMRNFEAAMAGACFLVQATPEGYEFFEDEKEVIYYSTAEELIDKATFLLKNEPFRKRLRAAVRSRALSEHTWAHRFRKAFSELGLC